MTLDSWHRQLVDTIIVGFWINFHVFLVGHSLHSEFVCVVGVGCAMNS